MTTPTENDGAEWNDGADGGGPTRAIVVGPDRGLGTALAERGVSVERVEGVVTRDDLRAAGVEDADLLVLTDVDEATAVPVALDDNPGLRVVVYSPETMPEYVRAQVDLAIDTALLEPAVVAEELIADE